MQFAGYTFDNFHVELLGAGDGVPTMHAVPSLKTVPDDLREVVLRIAVQHRDRAAVERFTKEFAPLITSGPAGLAGYAAGRSPVRQVLAYWPTLVPRELLQTEVKAQTATDWLV